MIHRVLLAALAVAMSATLIAAPTLAQTPAAAPTPATQTPAPRTDINGRPIPTEAASTRRNGRPAHAMSPEQIKAAAEGLITATSSTCQVTGAVLRGQIAEGQPVYEAACATGPGLILIGSTPPQATDCVLLAGQAEIDRARDPAADVGMQCQIEANKDVVKVIAQYATAAGVTCTVDQGASVGKSGDNVIYEVGCAGVDGYWLEKTPTGWTTTSCAQIITSNGVCRYSTAAEQTATLKGWMAGNAEAAACDVTQSRYMGANANGAFYEAKCATGDGVIVRFDNAKAVQQVYPCATSQQIGGGCKLGQAAAATPAPAPAPAAAPVAAPVTR